MNRPALSARFRPVAAAAAILLGVAAGAEANGSKADADADADSGEAPEVGGVLIGEFLFRGIRGAEGVKTRLSFSLYAAVDAADEERFESVLERRRHRIREQVITAIRLTKTSDLHEPSLESLKRRILTRLRRTSPELPIRALHFRRFALMFD